MRTPKNKTKRFGNSLLKKLLTDTFEQRCQPQLEIHSLFDCLSMCFLVFDVCLSVCLFDCMRTSFSILSFSFESPYVYLSCLFINLYLQICYIFLSGRITSLSLSLSLAQLVYFLSKYKSPNGHINYSVYKKGPLPFLQQPFSFFRLF